MTLVVILFFLIAAFNIVIALIGEDREQLIRECEYSHDPAHIFVACCKCGYVARKD